MKIELLDTLLAPGGTVGALIREAADRFGDAPLLIDTGGRRLSRQELDSEASRVANALLRLGLPEGSSVGVFSPNTIEFVIAGCGILRSGLTFTPFNSSYKRRELVHQIRNSGAAAVLVDARLASVLDECRDELGDCRFIRLERSFWANESGHSPDVEIDAARDLAFLPYSSGTTGLSKGIELNHRNLLAAMRQVIHAAGGRLSPTTVCYCFLPLYHIYGFNVILNPIIATGGVIHLRERLDIDDCLNMVEQSRVTTLPVVPPVILALLARPDLASRDLSSIDWMGVGAAPVALPAVHRFVEITGVTVRQGYGMTETAGIASLNPIDCDWDPAETAGPPVIEEEFRIVDPLGGESDMPPNEPGELAIRGPNVMMGYHDAPDENRRALRDGWFHTGDIATIDELGRLRLVDRLREMIKYKGFQVMPAELESVILEIADVRDCAVIGKKDDEAVEIPKAFVVVHAGKTVTVEQIQQHVGGQLAGYKNVREVEFVEAIPRSPAGKILRRVLMERGPA